MLTGLEGRYACRVREEWDLWQFARDQSVKWKYLDHHARNGLYYKPCFMG